MSKKKRTERSWNCITGYRRIGTGISCFTTSKSPRLKIRGKAKYANGFGLTLHAKLLDRPLRWKKPRRIRVNSTSDTFHKDVPDAYICCIFETMNRAHWHDFQVLTKNSERLLELDPQLDWGENIWMGVTVESADHMERIDHLRSIGAHIKFLSLEPLLGPMSGLNLDGIDWVIVGGESGPGARLMNVEWVLEILAQCIDNKVAFFFKQWGGTNKKKNGRLLQGRTWDEYPGQPSEVNYAAHEYIKCLTSGEKSMLLANVPEDQLYQLLRDANLL